MSIRNACIRVILSLTLVIAALSLAEGQQAKSRGATQPVGYAFVSPNTQENLTLEEAKAGLNSPEEQRLIAEAHQVGCRLHQNLIVQKAVGSWSDGAEPSTVIRARTSKLSLRYAGSWLGKFARQKAILYFRQDRKGEGRMYVLYLPPRGRDMAAVARELEANGIANRTLAPQRRRLLVYIVDLKNELRAKVLAVTRGLRVRYAAIIGEGEFIGDDDREKAQQVFEQEIVKYEAAHRVRKSCAPNRLR